MARAAEAADAAAETAADEDGPVADTEGEDAAVQQNVIHCNLRCKIPL